MSNEVHIHVKWEAEFFFLKKLMFGIFFQELFKKLVPHHCLGAVWSNRDKKEVDTPSVLATVNQFNAVSYRVIATILKNPELKSSQRAKIIIRWLNIAQVSGLFPVNITSHTPSLYKIWSIQRHVHDCMYSVHVFLYIYTSGPNCLSHYVGLWTDVFFVIIFISMNRYFRMTLWILNIDW